MIKQFLPNLSDKEKDVSKLFIFITFIMLIVEYFGRQSSFIKFNQKYQWFEFSEAPLYAQIYTSASFMFFLFLAPLLFSFLFKDRANKGLGFDFDASDLLPYLNIIFIMIPVMAVATVFPSISLFYPLYQVETLEGLVIYESIYLLQFVGIEFFFRGWPLFQLDKYFGKVSIYMMTLPYALIHIHKPFMESLSAIVAGIVLGHLALKTKSIWPGVFVHGLIALSVDLFSLFHKNWF